LFSSAGFIGQFGKMMAEAITSKIRLCRVRNSHYQMLMQNISFTLPTACRGRNSDKKY